MNKKLKDICDRVKEYRFSLEKQKCNLKFLASIYVKKRWVKYEMNLKLGMNFINHWHIYCTHFLEYFFKSTSWRLTHHDFYSYLRILQDIKHLNSFILFYNDHRGLLHFYKF